MVLSDWVKVMLGKSLLDAVFRLASLCVLRRSRVPLSFGFFRVTARYVSLVGVFCFFVGPVQVISSLFAICRLRRVFCIFYDLSLSGIDDSHFSPPYRF